MLCVYLQLVVVRNTQKVVSCGNTSALGGGNKDLYHRYCCHKIQTSDEDWKSDITEAVDKMHLVPKKRGFNIMTKYQLKNEMNHAEQINKEERRNHSISGEITLLLFNCR